MRLFLVAAFLAAHIAAYAIDCQCEESKPEIWQARQCSLCREAELQPKDKPVFFLKDINPTKPNRWLALPRQHTAAIHPLAALPKEERTVLWTAAVAKATELWGDQWGLAYNGDEVRTQCHTHIHIGKLLDGQENDDFVLVDKPEEFPIRPNEGVWVHPVGKKYHVHLGGQRTEFVLMR